MSDTNYELHEPKIKIEENCVQSPIPFQLTSSGVLDNKKSLSNYLEQELEPCKSPGPLTSQKISYNPKVKTPRVLFASNEIPSSNKIRREDTPYPLVAGKQLKNEQQASRRNIYMDPGCQSQRSCTSGHIPTSCTSKNLGSAIIGEMKVYSNQSQGSNQYAGPTCRSVWSSDTISFDYPTPILSTPTCGTSHQVPCSNSVARRMEYREPFTSPECTRCVGARSGNRFFQSPANYQLSSFPKRCMNVAYDEGML